MEIEKVPPAGILGSFNHLDYIIQETPYAVAVFDREMRYQLANQRWINDYGLAGKTVIGECHYDLLPQMPESWKGYIRHGLEGEPYEGSLDLGEDANGKRQQRGWKIFPWYETNDPVPAGLVIMTSNISYAVSVAAEREAQSIEEARQARAQIETISTVNSALSMASNEEEILAAVASYAMVHGAARMLLSYADEIDAQGMVLVSRVVAGWAGDAPDHANPMLNRRLTNKDFPFFSFLYGDPDRLMFIEDILNDTRIDENARALLVDRGVKATLLIPLYSKTAGRWQGNVNINWLEAHTFSDEEKAIFTAIGQTTSAIVSSRRAYIEARDLAATLEQQVAQRTEELRQSQRLMRQVIDGIPALIFAKDRDSRYTLANQALANVHGLPTEKLVGMDLPAIGVKPDERDQFIAADRRVIDSRQPVFIAEEPLTGVDGITRWMQTSKLPIINDDGTCTNLLGIAIDITDLKAANQNARQASERLDLAIQGAQLGLWEWDLITDAAIFSERWASMFGYTVEEIEPNFTAFGALLHPDDLPNTGRQIDLYLKGEIPVFLVEFRVKTKDGKWKWALSSGKIMGYNADGKPNRMVGILQDIDERKRAEEVVREASQRFDIAIQGAQLGLWDWNLVTNDVVFSERWCAMLGYRVDEIEPTFNGFGSLLHPDDLPKTSKAIDQYLKGEIPNFSIEFRLKTKAGGWTTVLSSGKVMGYDVDGKPTRLVGIHQDITERKQSEEAVQDANAKFDIAIQGAQLGLWDWNLATNHILFSERWCGMLGYRVDEVEPSVAGFRALVHPEDGPRTVKMINQYLNGEIPNYNIEVRMKAKDGSWKNVLTTAKVMGDGADGKPKHLVGINQDITERKLAEEAVREANEKFDIAIQGAELGLWDWNLVTNQMSFSERMYEMLGYDSTELKQHIDGFTGLIHPDDLPRTTSVMDRYVKGEIASNKLQFRMKMKDGSWKWVNSSGKSMERDGGEQAVRMVGILEDVNDQKVAERERERLIRQLREASRYKDEFFAVMSHELRTPLNAMIGLLGIVLMKGKIAPDDANMVTRARANSDRLLTLINNILDISRMEAGRLQLTPTEVNLRRLVERLHTTMGVLAEQKHIDFIINIDEAIPETLHIDEDATIKVISNLLGNAFKFTEKGSVNLTIVPQGDNVSIEVKDTGAGIPAHMHEIIFESFRQVDASSTRVHGGSGLGLSIVRNLCQAMGGSIRLESESGKGSTFTAILPVKLEKVS